MSQTGLSFIYIGIIIVLYTGYSTSESTTTCPSIPCSLNCTYGLQVDKNGCDRCACVSYECSMVKCGAGRECKIFNSTSIGYPMSRCANPDIPEICQQPMDMGPCMGNVMAWYYDDRIDSCERFMFGGCRGNDNNFNTQAACELKCRKDKLPFTESCGYSTCQFEIECPNGYIKDDNGCDVCQCQPEVTTMVYQSEKDYYDDDDDYDEIYEDIDDNEYGVIVEYGYDNDDTDNDGNNGEIEEDDSIKDEHDDNSDECQTDHDSVICNINCVSEHVLDQNGCIHCQCISFLPEEVPSGCLPISRDQCGLICEEGYVKNDEGCDICECSRPKEWCSSAPSCSNVCPFGRMKGVDGCETCDCLDLDECDETYYSASCEWPTCKYGYQLDERGCRKCECANPCKNYFCERSEQCVVTYSEEHDQYHPTCIPSPVDKEENEHKHKCYEVMCAQYCEHGFMLDEHGCEICRCIGQPIRCPLRHCQPCEFGYIKDRYGCNTCDCRDDPCKAVTCDTDYVCESQLVQGCVPHNAVIAASVNLDFNLPPMTTIPIIDTLSFEQNIKHRLCSLMNLTEKNIGELQVMLPNQEMTPAIHVAFWIIRSEDTKTDLVQIYQQFIHSGEVSIEYGGLNIKPNPKSTRVYYSSQHPLLLQQLNDPGHQSKTIFFYLIIAIVCFTAFILILTLGLYKSRIKRVEQPKMRNRDPIYKPIKKSPSFNKVIPV